MSTPNNEDGATVESPDEAVSAAAAPPPPPAPTPQGAPAPQVGAAVPPAPAPQAVSPGKKLPVFLKISITLLVALTLASISLLFLGDFEGKFVRVFSTFTLFTVFVLLTALDTRRDTRNDWYAPVALIANTYILGLNLIIIWMAQYEPFVLGAEVFWKSLVIILVTRGVLECCLLLFNLGSNKPTAFSRFALVTSVFAVLSGIMFTAPIAIEIFDVDIPDNYWRIAVAVLIVTALGFAVTMLLHWFYGADERDARRAQRAAIYGGTYYGSYPQQPYAQQAYQQQAPQQVAAPAQPQEGELLPWPTFADGTPIPAGPDGQPDFSVPGAPQPPASA